MTNLLVRYLCRFAAQVENLQSGEKRSAWVRQKAVSQGRGCGASVSSGENQQGKSKNVQVTTDGL